MLQYQKQFHSDSYFLYQKRVQLGIFQVLSPEDMEAELAEILEQVGAAEDSQRKAARKIWAFRS